MLARLLDLEVGDMVRIELMDGTAKVVSERVSRIVQQLVGLGAYMEIGALNRMLGEEPSANVLSVLVDSGGWPEFFAALKTLPVISSLALERQSLATFRDTIGQNIGTSRAIYILLAVIIVVGVVYNAARIQLSERARELASLRVLGLTVAEVSVILLSELAILTMLAIPVGWIVGYWICFAVTQGFQSELFRIPLVIEPSTYATAGLIAFFAAAACALVVRRRVGRLDLVAVLKTRD
jgi:putative ABC transport system permease protein